MISRSAGNAVTNAIEFGMKGNFVTVESTLEKFIQHSGICALKQLNGLIWNLTWKIKTGIGERSADGTKCVPIFLGGVTTSNKVRMEG